MMRKVTFSLIVCLIISGTTFAQERFTDDFNDGNLFGWSSSSMYYTDVSPTVENGQCHISYISPDTAGFGIGSAVGAVTNFSFEVRVKIGQSCPETAGISATSIDGGLSYQIYQGNTLELGWYGWAGEDWETIYQTQVNANDGNWHTMKLYVSVAYPMVHITIWWDGAQMHTHTEQITDVPEEELYAHLALFTWGNNVDMWFDDVSITYVPFVSGNEYVDDFNDGNIAGWFVPSMYYTDVSPTVENGQCHISYISPDTAGFGIGSAVGAVTNFSFEVRVKIGQSCPETAGISATSIDGGLSYQIYQGNTLELGWYGWAGEDWETIYQTQVNANDGNWHTMKLYVSVAYPMVHITIWWDGAQMHTHTEQITDVPEEELYAHLALFTWGNNVDMWFDDVSITFTPSITGVEEASDIVPNDFSLLQNYPNPFNSSTKILYSIPRSGFVTLTVYDILGREIQTLVSEFQKANTYSVNFDASKLSSGLYFYKLQLGNFVETKKMLLLR